MALPTPRLDDRSFLVAQRVDALHAELLIEVVRCVRRSADDEPRR